MGDVSKESLMTSLKKNDWRSNEWFFI